MNVIVAQTVPSTKLGATQFEEGRTAALLDPLDADSPDDQIVVTTRRAICRVALVASETAGRFERESVKHDPMSWMLAPRQVFDGATAIDACLSRDACLRGILVHGLGLGLDVERAAIDALMAEDDDDFDEREAEYLYGDRPRGIGNPARGRASRATRLRLYTATICDTRDNTMFQAFHASVARSAVEVRKRLSRSLGAELAEVAEIRLGLHEASPLVIALVPAAVIEVIRQMQRDCASPGAKTFEVNIHQSIQA
ncbi:hypothetical protein [Sphingomonas sp. UV9]|uniref:hypothetical protein n=1 Tax=Sphingomonas sp. UV9 TaxID=1851410 RepID=UPI001F0CD621|nr:hypothetical protein [Sphingomonas sp. UV9]